MRAGWWHHSSLYDTVKGMLSQNYNAGGKEAEKTVTVAAGDSQDVSFSVTKEESGSYTVDVDGLGGSFTVVLPVKPPGINWALIGGIIGGVIVVGLLIFFLVRRRAAWLLRKFGKI